MERPLLKFLSSPCNKQRIKRFNTKGTESTEKKTKRRNLPLFSVTFVSSVLKSWPVYRRAAECTNR